MNECGYVPIKLFMETSLNFISFSLVTNYYSFDFFFKLKNVKVILSSWAVQNQVVTWIWPVGQFADRCCRGYYFILFFHVCLIIYCQKVYKSRREDPLINNEGKLLSITTFEIILTPVFSYWGGS